MTASAVSSLRERADGVDLSALCVMAAVLYVGSDDVSTAILSVVVAAVSIQALEWALEAADVDVGDAGVRALLGALLAGLGAVALASDGGSTAAGVGIVAIGSWVVLDGLYEHRHGDPSTGESLEDEDLTEAEMYVLLEHSRWVLEELREASRPLTAEELRSRTGLTEGELADVLELTLENGTVERVGNGYAVDEDELGVVAFVRGIVEGAVARLLRPFRAFTASG